MTYARFFAATWTYGVVRNTLVMPKMKKDDLYINRIGMIGMVTLASPIWFPIFFLTDLANLERKMRGMKTVDPVIPFF